MKAGRYRTDTIVSQSLRGNPLASPYKRELRIYLPPGYHKQQGQRYPVVYLLHGYGGDSRSPIVGTRHDLRVNFPLLARLRFARAFSRMIGFERLDRLIRRGTLPPFILVQPDASLGLPHIHGLETLSGSVRKKGSLYTNSPFAGNYDGYVFGDVLQHVDSHYRSEAEKSGRAIVGVSMGGYGALLGAILHPELFQAAVALSPCINCLDLLDVELVVPYNRVLFGPKRADEQGRLDLDDILDTCDLVFSKDRPLLPTVQRDPSGRIIIMDEQARRNWAASDIGAAAEAHPSAFEGVRLLFNCERSDEFGLAEPCRRLHATLRRLGIEHEFEIYNEPQATRISPHSLGIAWHILPALRFCLQHHTKRSKI